MNNVAHVLTKRWGNKELVRVAVHGREMQIGSPPTAAAICAAKVSQVPLLRDQAKVVD
ncbi:MAG: hypothetical protein KDA69_03655 [Planctomycetaceae bacterium]|nr:hypothetical protein [Planctomycetaceae bacterium]MCA9043387.1 hypothetical protein [Planctomycetaceae bacterium]